ncbi:MAG: hypothetical protein K2O61_02310 [Bacteroidaceae bacterium]|nr:hypothetical protein [Bacteroidaceae bacterium]
MPQNRSPRLRFTDVPDVGKSMSPTPILGVCKHRLGRGGFPVRWRVSFPLW